MKSEAEITEAYNSLGDNAPTKEVLRWVLGIETTQEMFDRIMKEEVKKLPHAASVLVINPKFRGCYFGMPEGSVIAESKNVEDLIVV